MSDSPYPYRTRKIPWLRVVQFHKEIVRRAEQGFFSLNGNADQAERWTSLEDFDPGETAGPWKLGGEQLRSLPFTRAFKQGQSESIYLGGPCYVARQKGWNNTYETVWCPLLYLEVELKEVEDEYEMVPKQGTWNLSPLIQSVLDHLEISTATPSNGLTARILEEAGKLRSGGLILEQAIWRAAGVEMPEIVAELRRIQYPDTFSTQPSAWVLFTPTTNYSALTRNLMVDYDRLEKLIATDPHNLGGLKILEEQPDKAIDKQVELLPLVPLNEAQARAVSSVLEGYPLTVVSGPPGTGKSQVVVALLLNAWARGKSVLLASNNNKAVDVVRERLEAFEADFPIAVRAGSRQKQNIHETLRRILNKVASAGRRGQGNSLEPIRIRRHRLELIHELAVLKEQLGTELPSRVDEMYEASLKAYGQCRTIIDTIETEEMGFRQALETLGITDQPAEFIQESLLATRMWLSRVEAYHTRIRQEEERYATLQGQITAKLEACDVAAAQLGNPATSSSRNWDLMLAGTQPDAILQWEDRAQKLLSQGNVEVLQMPSWEEAYGRWSTSLAADRSAFEFREFARQIHESCLRLEPKVVECQEIEQLFKSSLANLQESGGNADINVPLDLLDQWIGVFAEFVTLDHHLLDSSPWSNRSRLLKKLRELERQLRPGFPLEVWLNIGSLDDQGRMKFATVIERTRHWYKQRLSWQAAQPLSREIDDEFNELLRNAVTLNIEKLPLDQDIEAWKQVASLCKREAEEAEKTALYWRRVQQKEQTEASLVLLVEDWTRLIKENLLSETWARTEGLRFDRLLNALASNPTIKTANAVKSALLNGVVRTLTTPWLELRSLQQAIDVLVKEADGVPTPESLLREWWQERPKAALLPSVIPLSWNELPTGFELLEQLDQWLVLWNEHWQVKRPAAEREAQPHMTRALALLQNAVRLIHRLDAQNDAGVILNKLQDDLYVVFPLQELARAISRYGASELRRRASQLEAEVERLAFDLAKSNWLQALRSDIEAVRSIDQLESHLSKNGGRLGSDFEDVFRSALRAAPIWITTAQAPQAVPLTPNLFDIVVIDEASQCTVTNLLPLIYRGKSLVVLGDDKQLPAIPTVHEAEETALAEKYHVEDYLYLIGHAGNDVYRTSVESLPRKRGDILLLVEHYRSHPQIIGFSNRHIYLQQLELKKDPHRESRLPIASGFHKRPVQGFARHGDRGRSWINEPEAEMVIQVIRDIKGADKNSISLGVVTPFAAQKEYIRARLDDSDYASEVLVDSAYGFQGDEKDVIIFSPVVARGITPSACRWVEYPPNLINVAITRAREALILVADFDFCLRQEGLLRKLALYCNEIDLLRESSLAELELFSWMIMKGLNPVVHPKIGDIEVDFGLKSEAGKKLVIEVDGQQHHGTIEVDKARDAFLYGRGYSVIRIPAQDVFETPIAVMHKIHEHLTNL